METLIAMAIGSMLLLGAARFLPALQGAVLRQTQKQALDDELWQRLFTVARHLQRAGYCRGDCAGQPLYIAGGGDCVIARWDGNGNGRWDDATAAEPEATGFRLRGGALETRRGAVDCGGKGWEKITNPAAVRVTRFSVARQNIAGFAPEFTLTLAMHAVADPRLAAAAEYRVTGYNL